MGDTALMAKEKHNKSGEKGQGEAIPVSQIGSVFSTRANSTVPVPSNMTA
jgi:hypothetical protein